MRTLGRGFTLIELIVVVAIVGMLLALLYTGAGPRRSYSQADRTWIPGGGWVSTVTHDSHKFVVTADGGILHHPSCSCQSLTPSVISTLP